MEHPWWLRKNDGDMSNGRRGSTLAGRVDNLGDVDKFKARHGSHCLRGEGQGGGRGLGGDRVICFAIVSLPNIFRRGAIKELRKLLSGYQMAPSLPIIDVRGVFCPGDHWEVRFLIKNFIRLVA